MKKRIYDDDDGRTIADMTGIERRSLFFPRRRQELREKTPPPPAAEESAEARTSAPKPTLNREERRMYVLGALSAGLLIGLVFILGLGVVVLIFYLRARSLMG